MATKTEKMFRLEYAVTSEINASPERIWALLTDAARFPEWNSTVTRIDGTIAHGEKLALKVPLAPNRTFTPRVTAFQPQERMEWSDGMAPMFKGVRTFTLTSTARGTTEFSMHEVFTGVMLPLIKGSLPDFREAFDRYAADLKQAVES